MHEDGKKRIISVSRRTDIPAFYAEWFINRVRAGFCTVANPYNAAQVSRVSLRPEDVLGFVFWTRNPAPLIKYLPELDKKYVYYFHYTLIGYPGEIEPQRLPRGSAIKTFKELSSLVGKGKVIWRYDPVLLSNITDYQWHAAQITYLMKELGGFTDRLVISFIDPYRKTRIRLAHETSSAFELLPDAFEPGEYRKIAEFIAGQAKKYHIAVQSCAEEIDLSNYGIIKGMCVDDALLGRSGAPPRLFKKDPSQRKACGCVVSTDIGANNTCVSGCKYCYATSSMKLALSNYKIHHKDSPSLTGGRKKDTPQYSAGCLP